MLSLPILLYTIFGCSSPVDITELQQDIKGMYFEESYYYPFNGKGSRL